MNQFWSVKNGMVPTKHIYAGSTRVVSVVHQNDIAGNQKDYYFYYHPDHLGSTNFVTQQDGSIYEHVEYLPFGESWVSERLDLDVNANTNRYLFTSKELDQNTNLYYYGARYYDPRTSVWQSPDPILGSYLSGKPNGGVFYSGNLNLFAYTFQNPVKFIDPNGLGNSDYEENKPWGWPYTGLNGQKAHKVVFEYLKKNGFPEPRYVYDKPIGNQIGLEPDIVDTKKNEIWELKPITHLTKKEYHEKDQQQIDIYIIGYEIAHKVKLEKGDPKKLVKYKKDGLFVGGFWDSHNPNYYHEVYLYPGDSEKNPGMLYYSLRTYYRPNKMIPDERSEAVRRRQNKRGRRRATRTMDQLNKARGRVNQNQRSNRAPVR